jgi:hypothetical protein
MPRKPRIDHAPPTPFPEYLRAEDLSEISGFSIRRIYQLAEDGVLPKPEKPNQFPARQTVRLLFGYLRELADGLPAKRAQHLERQAKAEADIAVRKRDLMFKDAIPAPVVETAWLQVISDLRASILSSRVNKKQKLELIDKVRAALRAPRDYFRIAAKLANEKPNEEEHDEP